jgi:hypothetical protein
MVLQLDFASDQLKNDKDVVLEAVKQNDYALYYASEQLKNDKDIVLEAVKQDGDAIRYASDELQNDPIFRAKVYKIRQQKPNATQAYGWYHRIKLSLCENNIMNYYNSEEK